jgi:hypothetical protein
VDSRRTLLQKTTLEPCFEVRWLWATIATMRCHEGAGAEAGKPFRDRRINHTARYRLSGLLSEPTIRSVTHPAWQSKVGVATHHSGGGKCCSTMASTDSDARRQRAMTTIETKDPIKHCDTHTHTSQSHARCTQMRSPQSWQNLVTSAMIPT